MTESSAAFRPLVLRKNRLCEARCQVRCNGRLHTILRTKSGRLVLCNHNLKAEKARMELGGSECRCLEVLRLWRGLHDPEGKERPVAYYRGKEGIPQPLQSAYKYRWLDQQYRLYNTQNGYDSLTLTLQDRHEQMVRSLVQQELLKCRYRKSPVTGGHRVEVTVCLRASSPVVMARGFDQHNYFGGRSASISLWQVTVPLLWYYRVYKRNLSVIDGHFVLKVLADDPLTVIAVGQGRGFDLTICEATVHDAVGGPQLYWRQQP